MGSVVTCEHFEHVWLLCGFRRESVRQQLNTEGKENKKRSRICACGRKERKKKKKKKSLYNGGVGEGRNGLPGPRDPQDIGNVEQSVRREFHLGYWSLRKFQILK